MRNKSLLLVLFSLLLCLSAWAQDGALSVQHSFEQPGEIQPSAWRLVLTFSHPVAVLDLSRSITYMVGGKEKLFTIINATDSSGVLAPQPLPSERNVFVVEPKEKNSTSASCSVVLKAGLKSSDGKVSLKSEVEMDFEACNFVELVDVTTFYNDADDRGIRFALSQGLLGGIASGTDGAGQVYAEPDATLLKKFIRITPSVGKFKIEKEKHRFGSTFTLKGNFETGKTYQLTTNPGEIGDSGYILRQASEKFVAKGPKSAAHFESNRSVIELKSRQTLPVSLVNVSKAQCQITRIPPFFAPEFSDLTLFTAHDGGKNRSRGRADDADEALIASAALQAEQKLVESVKKLDALKLVHDAAKAAGCEFGWLTGEFAHGKEAFFNDGRLDRVSRFSLPLSFRPAPEAGSAILVHVRDTDNPEGAQVARLFQVTDFSLTYKISEKSLLVWLTSLETGQPVPNAEVMVYAKPDIRVWAGKTDKDGLAIVRDETSYPAILQSAQGYQWASATLKIADVVSVTAANAQDACFVMVDTNRFQPFQVSQVKASDVSIKSRNTHIFTERGIYRPGETVFWKATMRKYEKNGVCAAEKDKVTVEIQNSKEEVIDSEEYELNDYGTCSGSLNLSDFAPLGQYTIRVKMKGGQRASESDTVANSGDDDDDSDKKNADEKEKVMTQTGFQVEKFVRPRHFVTMAFDRKTREETVIVGRKAQAEYLECRIESKYYTGGPVKMAKVRWTAHLVQVSPSVKGLGQFHFGGTGAEQTLIESGEALLDKDGAISLQLPLDANMMSGLTGIQFSATVLDVDAKPATTVDTFVPPVKVRVGLTNLRARIMEGDAIAVEAVAIDEAGNRIQAGNIRLEILRRRSFYTQKRDEEGNISYRWESGWMKTAVAGEQPIKDGKAVFEMGFDDSGSYQLQAVFSTPERDYFCRLPIDVGYVYYYYDDDDDGRRRRKSQNEIMLFLSKLETVLDESVKVDFTVPRPVTHALVTCERDDLLEYRVIPMTGRHGSFEMTMKAHCRPNAYLTVTAPCGRGMFPVYRSQADNSIPNVFYGVSSVKVLDTLKSLNVAIQPQDAKLTARPAETRKLEFIATDKDGKPAVCEMAVCVVDEAVLALTGYLTPILTRLSDFTLPLSVFWGDLRLSLVSQELYKLFATNPLTGGDMGSGGLASDLALRKDFRPVAYWNPALMTDANGKAEIEFKLPDSTTAYRVYVVALDKGSAFYSGERQMVVTKEFFLQPGMPRFLTAGDKARFPLVAANKTETSGQATLQVVEAKNLMARLPESVVNLTPLANTVTKVELEADAGAGPGMLTFSGRYNDFTDAIQEPLHVYPRYTVIPRGILGHSRGKTEVKTEIPDDVKTLSARDLQETLKGKLSLSVTDWNKIVPGLKYLLQYPYGCIEQTSSGIVPLAGLRKLIIDGLIPGFTQEDVDKFLKPGITRLFTMQLRSGGFSYWPGGREESWWGTLYAVFALTLAQEAGFDVPAEQMSAALGFISKNLFGEHKGENYHRYGIDELAAVNLALNKKLTKENLTLLMKGYADREVEGKSFLLWANAIVGLDAAPKLKEYFKKINPKHDENRSDWHDSSNREIAAALLAGMIIDPKDKRNDDFAGSLLKALKPEGRWVSTADTGMCLFALSRYFQRQAPQDAKPFKVSILQNGKPPVEVMIGKNGTEVALDGESLLANGSFAIETEGNKLVNWALEYSYPDVASRAEELNHGYQVFKTITNMNGDKDIRVGDILKVVVEFEDHLSIDNKYGSFEYLAIEDPLPAGLVAINTALKTEQKVSSSDEEGSNDEDEESSSDWDDGAYILNPDHFELHDERVLAFKNRIWAGKHRLIYYARAACEGEFWLRPTRVSLMYDPETFGLTQGELLKVLPPK